MLGRMNRLVSKMPAMLLCAATLSACSDSNDNVGPESGNPPSGLSTVPIPKVEGPITGGSHGWPWWETPFDVGSYGYVEEEFFLSGVASDRGVRCPIDLLSLSAGSPAFGFADENPFSCTSGGEPLQEPYKVRILVRRPTDPSRFNGTAVLEWANVSLQMEIEHDWPLDFPMLMREGFVSAMVSAQEVGIQGGGPYALKTWDAERYGTLHHPGDDFSYDIYAQAAQAIRQGLVVDGLPVKILLGTGTSQSCLRLNVYIPQFQAQDQLFDGFHPTLCPAAADIPEDLAPMVWGTSESEALLSSRPDGELLRVWEIPGSHINYYEASMAQVQVLRATGLTGAQYDESEAGQYGERGPVQLTGALPVSLIFDNTFPTRYSFRAALHHLNRWVRERNEAQAGIRRPDQITPAPAAPRFESNGFGRDSHGNVAGGVPQPALNVPVANYVNVTFGGVTLPFDPVRLALLYPTHEDYVSKMQAATDKVVGAGYMLPEDAEEWMARVAASSIGNPVALPSPVLLPEGVLNN